MTVWDRTNGRIYKVVHGERDVVKVIGTDLVEIDKLARQVEQVLRTVPGTSSAYAERSIGGYYLDIVPDRTALGRYGLSIGDVQDVISMALGAKVILTPAAERATGMIKRAEEFAAKHGAFLARQFENPANPAFHRSTTGPEILQDFAGRRLDWYVTGWGTGGTLTGAGQMIKAARPETKIVTTEPAGASMLAGKDWTPHKIQGWTPNLVPAVLDRNVYDYNLPVTDELARDTARALAQQEGIFCGISAGGTFTVSNLGMFGVTGFDAVINPGQAGILAVGEVSRRPVVTGETIGSAHQMEVTLACDHRILYGAEGAEFLASIKANLEEPGLLA